MTPLLRKFLSMNWPLVLIMLGLAVTGVFFIESAARHLPGGGDYYAGRQKMWISVGIVVFFITALIDYRCLKWLGIPLYLGGLVLMIFVLQSGNEVHQLTMAGLSFQPAQLGIAGGIVLISSLLQELPKLHRIFNLPYLKVLIIGLLAGIPFLIVIKMGDMGSALVWLPVTFIIMFVAGIPYRYLLLMAIIGIGFIPIIHYIVLPQVSERGANRIQLYLDILQDREVDTKGAAYAPYWVATAVGKAGWKGLGGGATAEQGSLHDKKYIPWKTAHNDFIFAVIGEEQGYRGSILLLGGYCLLLVLCIFIGLSSRDTAGRILSCAVVALFFAHIFENIGMCVHLTPITGIPLPLISYSGTFLVMCMFLLGLVQSVWIHRNVELEEVVEERPVRRFA